MQKLIKRRNLLKATLAAGLIPYGLGCSSQKRPLRISGHLWPGYELIFMGQDMGMIDSAKAQLLPTESASASMQAIRDNKVHGAMLTLDEAMRLSSEGIKLQIILVFNISIGADALIAKPEIKSLKDLKGKTLGYEASALGALMLASALEKAQLTKDQIKLKQLTIDQQESAWINQEVDALITFEPLKTKIQKHSQTTELFNSKDIPNSILDVLVVTQNAANLYPKELKELLRVQFKALHHFRTNPMDASYRISKRIKTSPEEILGYYQGLFIPDALTNFGYLSKEDPRITNAAERLKETMLHNGITHQDDRFNYRLTNKFIPKEFL